MARFSTSYEALNIRSVITALIAFCYEVHYFNLYFYFKKITVFRNVFAEGDIHCPCYL